MENQDYHFAILFNCISKLQHCSDQTAPDLPYLVRGIQSENPGSGVKIISLLWLAISNLSNVNILYNCGDPQLI